MAPWNIETILACWISQERRYTTVKVFLSVTMLLHKINRWLETLEITSTYGGKCKQDSDEKDSKVTEKAKQKPREKGIPFNIFGLRNVEGIRSIIQNASLRNQL